MMPCNYSNACFYNFFLGYAVLFCVRKQKKKSIDERILVFSFLNFESLTNSRATNLIYR